MLKLLPVVTCCCLHLNILAWLVLCSEHSFMEAASRRISKSIESNQQVRNKCLRTSVLTFWLHLFQHGWIVCLKLKCGMFATCSIKDSIANFLSLGHNSPLGWWPSHWRHY